MLLTNAVKTGRMYRRTLSANYYQLRNEEEDSAATSLSSAVSLLPPSPRSSHTRSGTRTAARRSTKKRRI
ncbi:hypothetical protein RO3G_01318 [Rhizopus delemar RA 99-880]|uniref:Uncharacterized protein n=1 Tax=Rhizopus delemar (strain RA 99-880 / ATCC MYA-4621 / FGSC 9543 / NRRL 43880) TaxID=246409 RepID=I1BK84_RHIO9|nr:hypothetical protein RO3G_01318 [Rhizopus delemar RA 99-880]|eukprot:EIE76614.1 hypothetical protein RO3G_01318 [Rhizopus delemar RA 99-880]